MMLVVAGVMLWQLLLPPPTSSSLTPTVQPARVGQPFHGRVNAGTETILEYHVITDQG